MTDLARARSRAIWTASALLRPRITPAPSNSRSCWDASCGSSGVPHTEATNERAPPGPRRRLPRFPDYLRKRARGIVVGAVAEHQVQEDHGHLRVGGFTQDAFRAQPRIDHRMRTSPRQPRVAQVHHRVPLTLPDIIQERRHGSVAVDRPQRLTHEQHRLGGQRAAAVEPADEPPAGCPWATCVREPVVRSGPIRRARCPVRTQRLGTAPPPRGRPPPVSAPRRDPAPVGASGAAPRKFTTTGLPARRARSRIRAQPPPGPGAWRPAR